MVGFPILEDANVPTLCLLLQLLWALQGCYSPNIVPKANLESPRYWTSRVAIWEFPKIRIVPCVGVLTIRILLFRVFN